MKLWNFIISHLDEFKEHVAITIDNEDVSYRNLYYEIESYAVKLKEILRYSGKIAVINDDAECDALSILGGLAAGKTVIPLTIKYGSNTSREILNFVFPELIVTNNENLLDGLIQRDLYSKSMSVQVLGKTIHIIECVNCKKEELENVELIMFTSGTTGKPKGVMLSAENIISNLLQIEGYFHITNRDHLLIIRPLQHISAITGELLYGLYKKSKITIYNDVFHPKLILQAFEKTNCTVSFGTPTVFYNIAKANKNEKKYNLEKVVLSGECLKHEVVQNLREKFKGVDFLNVYGLTEASPRVTALSYCDFFKKVGSVGKQLEGINIKVEYESFENDFSENRIGEIMLDGPNVFKGYYKNDCETKKILSDKFLKTGDVGYFDDEGYLYVLGRKDNMIIKAGNNIFPEQIESIVLELKGIKEAYVWGEENLIHGLKINMDIALEEDTDITEGLVMAYCQEKLDSIMWPNNIRVVDEIEKSESGKIKRKKM